MSLKKLATGIALLGGSIGLLVNFGDARTELVKLWPTIAAVLPVLALGGALGGVTLIGGSVWRWHVARRPTSPEERFHQLVPDIEWLFTLHEDAAPSTELGRAENAAGYFRTRDALTALGVGLPDEPDDLVKLLVSAKLGKLAKARRWFPLQPKDDGPAASD